MCEVNKIATTRSTSSKTDNGTPGNCATQSKCKATETSRKEQESTTINCY